MVGNLLVSRADGGSWSWWSDDDVEEFCCSITHRILGDRNQSQLALFCEQTELHSNTDRFSCIALMKS